MLIDLTYSENEDKSVTGKEVEVIHFTQERGGCFTFVYGMVALFLSLFRQNYEVALCCLILSWSHNNLVWG